MFWGFYEGGRGGGRCGMRVDILLLLWYVDYKMIKVMLIVFNYRKVLWE